MVTVITETTLQSGEGAAWDRAFQERLRHARTQPGWIGLELLIPQDDPNKRVVVGTWKCRDDWSIWHQTETFQRTREAMNAATKQDGDERWFDVVTETFDSSST
jgi:heme-degrading monooxygenase HmoA